MQFGLIGKVVSEKKMFEHYCHIHVYSSGGMGRRSSGSILFFMNINILSIWSFPANFSPLNALSNSFPHSNAQVTKFDLVVKLVKVYLG